MHRQLRKTIPLQSLDGNVSQAVPFSIAMTEPEQFTQSPSNETTKLVSAIVSKLEVRDVRWDMLWSFGDVLREVPQRLGNSHALDAAATAVVETIPVLTQAAYSPQMIRAYAHALRTLQDVLTNSMQAMEAETWVAIYLMFICQVSVRNPVWRYRIH